MNKFLKLSALGIPIFFVSCNGTGKSSSNDSSAVNMDSMVNQAQASVSDSSSLDSTTLVIDSTNKKIDSAMQK